MENKAIIIVLLLLAAGMGGFFYFYQSSADDTATVRSSPPQMDGTVTQERPSFEAQKDTEETSPKPPPVEQKYAPGTAEVRVRIDSVASVDQRLEAITVTVQQVNGYGPSTPPIVTGTQFTFDIFNYMKSHPEQRRLMNEGEEITMVVASRQGVQVAKQDNSPKWSFVELKE